MRRNTLSAGLQHLNWKCNVFVHRKIAFTLFAFAFAFVTGYLSCQLFLMTFVYWPDKELRPVADSISFSTDNIRYDIQWNRKKFGTQLISIGVTRCWYLDAFPYQNFSVKARCNHFSPFLKVCSIGPCLHVLKFSTLGITFLNFKLSCFWLTFSHGIRVDVRQEWGQTFELTKENG